MQEDKIVKRIPTNLVTKTIITSSAEYEPNKEYTDEDANVYEKYLQAITNVSIGIDDDIEKIKALEDNILEQYNKNVELADKMEQETEKFARQANTAIEDYNSNAETKTEEFNTNAKEKTDEFNSNATEKKTEISDIADSFDTNAEEKTNTFNSNVETKTTEFNNNSTAKTEEFNNNSTEKINAFNSNAEEKIADYNEHVETLTSRIADLEEENSELAQQMPWNTTKIQESIYVADSAEYSKNKLDVFGKMTQETREGYNLIDINMFQDRTINGISFKKQKDNSILINGTSTGSISFKIATNFTIPAGEYTLYIPYVSSYNSITVSLADSSGTTIRGTDIHPYTNKGVNANCKNISFNTDITVNNLNIYIGKEAKVSHYVLKWMLVKGKYTEDTIPPYESCGAMPSFKYPSMPVVATGLQTVKKYSKNLCKSFINGSIYRFSGAFYLDCNLEKGKYYALSFTDLSVGNVYYRNEYITGNNNTFSNYAVTSTGERQTWIFLCKENDKNIGDLYSKNKGYYFLKNSQQQKQPSNVIDVQLEEVTSLSSLATDYEQCSSEDITLDLSTTELCKITDSNGNVVAQDRPVYREVNGTMKWQFEKQINKLVITGTTFNFKLDKKDDSGKLRFLYSGFNCYSSDFWVCDKLKVLTYRQFINPEEELNEYICGGGNYPRVYIKIDSNRLNGYTEELTDAEVVTLFKEFLNKNNITVYYIQGTSQKIIPEYEDCTDKQTEILDKLYKLKLRNGINNIFVESKNGVTTELQLKYMQDNNLKKEQENKALEDRITAIENLLSTTQTSALLLDNMQTDLEKEVE